MKIFLAICFLFPITLLLGQKNEINPSIYNDWKKNENQIVSANGNFISYEINPHRGDGFLLLYDIKNEKIDSFPRGKEAKFSFESDYFVFKITPGFDTLRTCELDKVDKKKWPKDTLGIYLFEKDTLLKIPLLKSFSIGKENNWLSYIIDENVIKQQKIEDVKSKKSKKNKAEKKDKLNCASSDLSKTTDDIEPILSIDCKKKKKTAAKTTDKTEYKSDGKVLTIFNPIVGIRYQYKDVTDHSISKNGQYLAFIEHKKEKIDSAQLVVVDLTSGKISPVLPKYTSVKSLTFNQSETLLAFHSSTDTTKVKTYSLNLYNLSKKQNKILADTSITFLPKEDAVSENRPPLFTEDGRFMYFGVADRPEKETKDTLTESEKVELDIWHYQDKRLQSQQLVELKRDQKKTDLYVYAFADSTFIKLSNDTLNILPTEKQYGNYLFASSDEQYLLESQWETPNREDHYRISLLDGKIELLKKGVSYNGNISPSGNYYTYFDGVKRNYFLIDLTTKKENCITCSATSVNWQSDINGMPMVASPFGITGYSNGEKFLYIQSEYDFWTYSISEGKLTCITQNVGVQRKIRLEPKMWSSDSIYLDFRNLYFEGFNEKTKGTHLFELIDHTDHIDLKENYYSDHKINFLIRSKNKEIIVFRKMSLKDFPEVRFSSTNFADEKIISATNPQQNEYNWATVELVNWKSYDGIPLEGLIYKPENFDATKSYPLIIYFYELNADNFHNHYAPKPTASIIYPTEYASAGYIVFIPDIRYKPGFPAKSAYNCIMSGTDRVLKLLPNIDSTRMGLQGQSWGGYQTAQLITMTNRYAAAMAGAPVSNMFSAYGGIRWGSGMNRQFQYERTQSRIGKTIWEAPELYVENSPLFHLPNVKTPLLIMANDKDGAVPWYQGIELFTGLRRLEKPCWMLNYNGDDHNLMENANRMDLSIRMRQYFDYYLLNKPAPKWLKDGIPAIDKGKTSN
jgi:dipeptidyl aminopeptidase/acylaminoacyl peptidase